MSEQAIKVLVVDDHPVVRVGLVALLRTEACFQVVGEAGTAAQAIEQARRNAPDVVIMDVRLPDSTGIEALFTIRSERPATQVLMLTSYADEDLVVDAIKAGAAGYLLKQSDPERLFEAIRAAAHGESLLDPVVTRMVLDWMQRQEHGSGGLAGLTPQEERILPLLAEGKTNREIAAGLGLADNTVKSYVSDILRKLSLTRRGQVSAYLTTRRQRPDA